jgi:predicted rRNA methylase YqxC with S4 and FtsJ domains
VNLGRLTRGLVPEPADVITIDLSYLSLARAVPQLESLAISRDADLVALVKPMYELGLERPPVDARGVARATALARAAIEAARWTVVAGMPSPIPGGRGGLESLVHARRSTCTD